MAGRNKARKVLRVVGIVCLVGFLAGVLGIGILFAWVSRDLPDPNRLLTRQVQKSTKIWDRTGEHLLYEIHGEQNRTLVELDQISEVAVKAAIVSEDKHFYEHKGFQLTSLVRAGLQAFRRGRVEGTSTITQQLIKNAILTNERALTRKAKELILAYQIEHKFSKDEILKMYFNEIPYGSSSYGIQAASQSYFGKSAKDLDAAEGALIAALTKAPSRLSPYGNNKDELLWWQRFIIDDMAKEGYITTDEAEAAKAKDILAEIKPRRDSIEAPHFVLHVKELLSEKYGEREVETGGLNVVTTLDYDKQKFAQESVTEGMDVVKEFGGSNAALLAMDPKNGQVLAMVGSADYFDTEHDGNVNVTLRARQPGSSFKPIVYAAAFEKGFTPSTVVFDVETDFPTDTGTPYHPHNYDLSEHGPVTLKKALAGSLNIPAVKTLYLAGIDKAIDFAEKLGYGTLKDRSRFGLSLVLGGAEVRLVEHVAAYSTFATEGTYHAPAYILKVQSPDGTVLEEWKDEPVEKVMDVQTARNINDILSDNSARAYVFGEKNYLTLPDRPVAAKTGTTNLFVDAWTMGYTPSLAAGVWVGNNDSTQMKSKADGSRVAAPIWQAFMKKALENAPVESFTAPDPIVTGKPVLDGQAGEIAVKIDRFSGKLASENTPPTAIEERIYRQAHDILYYVDKDDPRGPYPADTQEDPQYLAWENAVAAWAQKNGWVTTEAPPTEVDDVHRDEFSPIVSFELPTDNAEIAVRSFPVRVSAGAPRGVKRVEYSLDGVTLATATSYPWEAVVTLPSTYGRGFYTLRATAFDDIEHAGSQDITINVTSDGKPLALDWLRPTSDITYRQRAFPIYIDTTLSERAGVSRVDIVAVPAEGEPIVIGSLSRPATNGVSVTWTAAPEPGVYRLKAIAHLPNDEVKEFEGPKVTVKE
ncbi:MAG TPA: penicillin-binding protein [Patescibacteria group bacterium]|nr:penicillin-binding protein [Patescibacteria group bacterium]